MSILRAWAMAIIITGLVGAAIVGTYGAGLDCEMVTPTGAAILTTLAQKFGPWPAMTIREIGLGAGKRDLADRPNIIRLIIGTSDAAQAAGEELIVAQTSFRATHIFRNFFFLGQPSTETALNGNDRLSQILCSMLPLRPIQSSTNRGSRF